MGPPPPWKKLKKSFLLKMSAYIFRNVTEYICWHFKQTFMNSTSFNGGTLTFILLTTIVNNFSFLHIIYYIVYIVEKNMTQKNLI